MSKNDSSALAASLGLNQVDTVEVVEVIRDKILLNFYQNARDDGNEELAKKCINLYKSWYPAAVFNENDQSQIRPPLLIGPPGHGKTTSFRVALKEVAKGLGLKFLENNEVIDQFRTEEGITKEHVVFISQETAGLESALLFAGLPAEDILKLKRGEVKILGKLYDPRFLALEESAGGVLLLDDFFNAKPEIQDMGLSILNEKRYISLSLKNACIGVTGNMGSYDATFASSPSAALRNRCEIYYTEDKWKNFVSRIQTNPEYRDEIGDVGVSAFLERLPQNLYELPNKKELGAYTTPRSWEGFIAEARREVAKVGGRGNMLNAAGKIFTLANATIGGRVGHEFSIFFQAMADLADPLARKLINEGELDKETFKKKYDDGASADEKFFAYQFASALADYTTQKIIRDKTDMKEALGRFAIGISHLDGQSFAHCANVLMQRLANQVDEFAISLDVPQRSIKGSVSADICNTVYATNELTKDQMEMLVDVMVGRDKNTNIDNTPVRRRRKKTS